MVEIKYSKEGAKNYLILPCPDGKEEDFQIKMMERGNLQLCVPCKLRHMNGQVFLYYDITSKVSMKNYRNGKKWTREQIVSLLVGIDSAQGELQKYLLMEKYLILIPELIFYDYESKSFLFLFYPSDEESQFKFETLLEYLLDNMDHQDEKMANIMYEMFEEAESGVFTIQRLVKKLDYSDQEISIYSGKTMTSIPEGMGTEELAPSLQQGLDSDRNGANFERIKGREELDSQKREGNRHSKYYMILLVIAIITEVGIWSVYLLLHCSRTEELILVTVSIVVGIMGVVTAYLLFKEKALQRRKEYYDESLVKFRESDYVSQNQPQLKEVTMKDFLYKSASVEKEMLQESDETTFFEPDLVQENKLYALDKKNKVHISLDSLPCTIGKAAEMVDYSIKDNSVSRMHAKIERQNGRFILTDLNSTNGTFVNGLQMTPNEQVEIERGDEIRFGKMRYSFR